MDFIIGFNRDQLIMMGFESCLGIDSWARKIAYFRKENTKVFKMAFRHFVRLLKDWDLIEGETIAIDSFKIRAQNALKNNFNQKKIDRHIDYIDNKILEYQSQPDTGDTDLDIQGIQNKIVCQKTKKEKYRNIINVGYNVQAGCDAKHKLFVNNDTGTVNDTHALSPMALDAKELLGLESMRTLTDKGYTTAKHLEICTKNGITPYSSPKVHSSQRNGLYPMFDFKYDRTKDTYTCPDGQILATNRTVYDKAGQKVKHYKNRQACKVCLVRHLFTVRPIVP